MVLVVLGSIWIERNKSMIENSYDDIWDKINYRVVYRSSGYRSFTDTSVLYLARVGVLLSN